MKGEDYGAVPRWNGDPLGFQKYKEEVKIFTLRSELTKRKVFAADLVTGLSGSARASALTMTEDQLAPGRVNLKGDDLEGWYQMNTLGIKNLLDKLKADLMESASLQKGERMNEFFSTNKYHRKTGMRFAEYNLLWDRGVQELKDVGIKLDDDVEGWFYLKGARLTNEQRECVMSKLVDDKFPVKKLKEDCARMFQHMNFKDNFHFPGQRTERPSFRPPRRREWRSSGTRDKAHGQKRSVMVAENEPEESEETEGSDGTGLDDSVVGDFGDMAQAEVQQFARELENADEDALDYADNVSPDQVQEACTILNEASEALQTVREARMALRKKPGKGGGKSRKGVPPPPSASSSGPPSRAKSSVSERANRLRARKAKTRCMACGQIGHWQGDPECPKKQSKSRGALIADAPAEEEASGGSDRESAVRGEFVAEPRLSQSTTVDASPSEHTV